MKTSKEQLIKMIGFEVKNMDFIMTELIDWINEYGYDYEVVNGVLVREDLQQDWEELATFTIDQFICDWLDTLDNKAENYLYGFDENKEEELKCINDFKSLHNGLKEIYNIQISKKIVTYLNESNRGKFTQTEQEEFIKEYKYMIENQEVDSIVKVLEDDYKNSKNDKALNLVKGLNRKWREF